MLNFLVSLISGAASEAGKNIISGPVIPRPSPVGTYRPKPVKDTNSFIDNVFRDYR